MIQQLKALRKHCADTIARIDATLEALSAVKDLTLGELTALLEAVNEKVQSSMDFDSDEKELFNFDDALTDCAWRKQEREAEAARQAENETLDRKFGFVRGDTTHD